MEIKTISTTGPMYKVTITEHERFMLSCALCHARRYAKMMEYGNQWCGELEAMQDILDIYEDDED